MENILKHIGKHGFIQLREFRHVGEIGFCEWFHDDIASLSLKLSHLGLVAQLEVSHEMFAQLHVQNPNAVSYLLEADDTKLWHINRPSNFGLALTPIYKGVPNQVVSCLTDDAPNRVRVASKISLNGFITKSFYIEVAIATSLLHVHSVKYENK
jgi:hypothetical protein